MPNILPGPWHLEYDGERDSYMVYDAPPNEDGEVFMTIAEVHVGERVSSQCHQPSHARLIAAAPELYAALQEAVRALNTAERFSVGDTDSYAIAALGDKAIHKAEKGRE